MNKMKCVLLTLVVILGLTLLAKPLPRQKAHAQHINTMVNRISRAPITILITNPPPAATSNK
jgi:hypothetical protein